jgi:hypothetical protein
MQIEKKLTVKTVLGGKPDIEKIIAASKDGGKALPLIEVYGIATGTKAGNTDMGPFVKLTGQFLAVNLETGEKKRSGVCILPSAANDIIAGALAAPEAKGVEFGVRISAKYDKDAATNYTYNVEMLQDMKENDPLEMLASKIKTPALSAPAPAPAQPAGGNGDANKPAAAPAAQPKPEARPAARR